MLPLYTKSRQSHKRVERPATVRVLRSVAVRRVAGEGLLMAALSIPAVMPTGVLGALLAVAAFVASGLLPPTALAVFAVLSVS
jgi:hypothetical protein